MWQTPELYPLSGAAFKELFHPIAAILLVMTIPCRLFLCACCLLIAGSLHAAEAPKYTNHLANEKSPYLLQHAHNPVDWYPWGEEAFAAAKKQNKPIFLSVGYSTCHWCHVMERESFENEATAKLINETCIAIKVDREERPDVDRVYMTYVQAATGSGGWPMNVLLTPDLKPFFGGTYFPPEDKDGQVGLKTIMTKTREAWANDRANVQKAAGKVADELKNFAAAPANALPGKLDAAPLAAAFEELKKSYDAKYGGFDAAPKFPQPVNLNLLFHYWARTGDQAARDMAVDTLRAMAGGGIHDQLGGGFHRYSTDAKWFLPHFEIMLYDQAQISASYLDAYQATHDEAFATVARDTLDYVLRDMTGKTGEFFSAEDADSATAADSPEKHEGAFYIWSADEIGTILGKENAAIFAFAYGVEQGGNVENDPRKEFTGKNVLFRGNPTSSVAKKFNKPEAEIESILKDSRAKLLAARAARPRPHLDDKTLTAWNGLMISSFARAAHVLKEEKYLAAANRAADFIIAHLYDAKTHTLYRRYRDGQRDVQAFADDYAFFIQSLIGLYEAGGDIRRIQLALELQSRMDELFLDKTGGYFSTTPDPSLLVRMKDQADNVEPAASSIAALNLLRLSQMTDSKTLRQRATDTLNSYSERLATSPANLPQMLVALDFSLAKPKQIVIASDAQSTGLPAMVDAAYSPYLANRVIMYADGATSQQFLAQGLSFLKDVTPLKSRATAYVCENYACQLPTSDLAEFAKLLKQSAPKSGGK